MTGMPREVPKPRTGFAKNCGGRLTRLRRALEHGRALVAACAGMYFHDIPSAWYSSFEVMAPRSSRWHTVAAGSATGDRASDRPSNFRMQRSALRAAADSDRSAAAWPRCRR
jgi:hypothetical protein